MPRPLTKQELEAKAKAEEEARRKKRALIALGLLFAVPRVRNSFLTFDASIGRYRAPDGRFVAKQAVRREAYRVVQTSAKHILGLSERLRSGEITVAEWVVNFREQIKAGHSLAYILARGGRDAMTGADWGRVGQLIRFEYDALNRFASQIQDGGAINLNRVKMYANSIRATYENTLSAMALERNPKQKAKWVRTANESCPGCIEQESRGEQLLDAFPDIGSQQCLSNCKCFIQLVD